MTDGEKIQRLAIYRTALARLSVDGDVEAQCFMHDTTHEGINRRTSFIQDVIARRHDIRWPELASRIHVHIVANALEK